MMKLPCEKCLTLVLCNTSLKQYIDKEWGTGTWEGHEEVSIEEGRELGVNVLDFLFKRCELIERYMHNISSLDYVMIEDWPVDTETFFDHQNKVMEFYKRFFPPIEKW